MFEIVGEVLVKDVVTHIVVVVVFGEFVVPHIAVGVVKLAASFVVVKGPCKNLEIVVAPVNFVAHVAIVKVLEESIVAQVVVVKVLEGFVVPTIVAIVIIVGRKFVVPISFAIPTIVLIALVIS